MKERLKFRLVKYASSEEALKMTAEERLEQNDLMVNRILDLETFLEKFYRGYNFIKSQHVHPRKTKH